MFQAHEAREAQDLVALLYKRVDERVKSCFGDSKARCIYAINFDQIINKQK
jgi:hypothetical protein